MENEYRLLNFIQDIENWLKWINSISFVVIKKWKKFDKSNLLERIKINNLQNEKDIIFEINKEIYWRSDWKKFKDIIQSFNEEIKKYKDQFCYIKLKSKNWIILSSVEVSRFHDLKWKKFVKQIMYQLFLFWIKTEEKILKKEKEYSKLKNKKFSISEDIDDIIKKIESEKNDRMKSYWEDFYIDEDYSINIYFDLFSFEEIRDWKLSDIYKKLINNYPLIFSDTYRDLYLTYIPYLRWWKQIFLLSFFDTILKWNKKEIKFIDDFYKKNKEFIKEFINHKWDSIKSEIFDYLDNTLNKFSFSFILYLNERTNFWINSQKTQEEKIIELENNIREYLELNSKIKKFLIYEKDIEDVFLQIRDEWRFKIKKYKNSKFNWNKVMNDFFISILNEKNRIWVINFKNFKRIQRYLNRQLDKSDFDLLKWNWILIVNIIETLFKNGWNKEEKIEFFNLLFEFLKKEKNHNNSHDIWYWMRWDEFKTIKKIRIFSKILKNFKNLNIKEFFSILSLIENRYFDSRFVENSNSFQEFISKFYENDINLINLNKKSKKMIMRNIDSLMKNWIYVEDVFNKLFSWSIQNFLQLTKKKNKNIYSDTVVYSKYYWIINWELKEIENIFKDLLWTKENYWNAKRPWKLYQKMNNNWFLHFIDKVRNENILDIKNLFNKFSKNQILLKRFSVKIERQDSINFWCSWNLSNCCMWYETNKLKDYLFHRWFSIMNIYFWDDVIWNALLYEWIMNWKKAIIIDNIELKNSYKKYSEIIIDVIKNYLNKLWEELSIKNFYQWVMYNDLVLFDDNENEENSFNKIIIKWVELKPNNQWTDSFSFWKTNFYFSYTRRIFENIYLDSTRWIKKVSFT